MCYWRVDLPLIGILFQGNDMLKKVEAEKKKLRNLNKKLNQVDKADLDSL